MVDDQILDDQKFQIPDDQNSSDIWEAVSRKGGNLNFCQNLLYWLT